MHVVREIILAVEVTYPIYLVFAKEDDLFQLNLNFLFPDGLFAPYQVTNVFACLIPNIHTCTYFDNNIWELLMIEHTF